MYVCSLEPETPLEQPFLMHVVSLPTGFAGQWFRECAERKRNSPVKIEPTYTGLVLAYFVRKMFR